MAGCFSFFPSKNRGAAGDHSLIVTNDAALAEHIGRLRNHGAKPKYYHAMIGGSFRLDVIQAAILMVKFPHLDSWSQARRNNAEYYNARFAVSGIRTPVVAENCVSILNRYGIRVLDRKELVSHMKELQVGFEIYYPLPLHLQERFAYLGYKAGTLPVVEHVAHEIVTRGCPGCS